MSERAWVSVAFAAACLLAPAAKLHAQLPIATDKRVFNEKGIRRAGQVVIPVYDGWFDNGNGTRTMCFSYFNMNTEQSLDVPLGPDNYIEPKRFDGKQPTHFDPVPRPKLTSAYRHYWCVFTETVPEDFGGRVVWHLTTQGDSLSVPGKIIAPYVLEEPESHGRNQVAPRLKLEQDAAWTMGRRGVTVGPRTVAVGAALTLVAWAKHPEPGTWFGWTKHQGPGDVTFSQSELRLDQKEGSVSTTARFSRPGDYVVRVQVINDTTNPRNPTGGFEFHCCWTNGYVKVHVTP